MAVAVSFNPANPKPYQSTTASVTGGAATTAYQMIFTLAAGHTQIFNFKTDGSGNASVVVGPNLSGSHTWNIYTSAPSSVANGTLQTAGC